MRPSRLFDGPGITRYQLHEDRAPRAPPHRAPGGLQDSLTSRSDSRARHDLSPGRPMRTMACSVAVTSG
jgi:hypothetical protein